MNNDKYSLRYTFDFETKPEGYDKKDVLNESHELCDAVLLVSTFSDPDGSYYQKIFSRDGSTGNEIDQINIFRIWLNLGLMLSENNALVGWQKEFVDNVCKSLRDIFIKRNKKIKD